MQGTLKVMLNPFVPCAPFLYSLKTSENRKVGCIENKWLNTPIWNKPILEFKTNMKIIEILTLADGVDGDAYECIYINNEHLI